MRVLVADDNNANRLIARAILERELHQVSLASNGPDAIELTRVRRYDVVLLDIMMPQMDGLRTIRRIKESRPKLPVFALTSYDSPADVSRYLSAGFDGVIAKPLAPGDLARVLTERSQGVTAHVTHREPVTDDFSSLPLADEVMLEDAIGQAARNAAEHILLSYRHSVADMCGRSRHICQAL